MPLSQASLNELVSLLRKLDVVGTDKIKLVHLSDEVLNAISGEGSVSSVFGRTGIVVAAVGDYAISHITGLQSALDGKATAAQGALADTAVQPPITMLQVDGGKPTGYTTPQDTVTGDHTFVQSDTGREKIFTGTAIATWTIPALSAGTHVVAHNIGTAPITFVASGVTLKGLTTLAIDKTAALSWLPGNVVKLTGELS